MADDLLAALAESFGVELCGPCRFCGGYFRCPPDNPNADDCGRHGVPR